MWCDVPGLFDRVDATVAVAAFVEGQGWTSRLEGDERFGFDFIRLQGHEAGAFALVPP